jgi:hypothetical protein
MSFSNIKIIYLADHNSIFWLKNHNGVLTVHPIMSFLSNPIDVNISQAELQRIFDSHEFSNYVRMPIWFPQQTGREVEGVRLLSSFATIRDDEELEEENAEDIDYDEDSEEEEEECIYEGETIDSDDEDEEEEALSSSICSDDSDISDQYFRGRLNPSIRKRPLGIKKRIHKP